MKLKVLVGPYKGQTFEVSHLTDQLLEWLRQWPDRYVMAEGEDGRRFVAYTVGQRTNSPYWVIYAPGEEIKVLHSGSLNYVERPIDFLEAEITQQLEELGWQVEEPEPELHLLDEGEGEDEYNDKDHQV